MMAVRRAGIALMLVLAVAALGWSEGQADTKERVTLRMFTTDAGVPVPQGVNPSDNWFVNIVEKYANVDLVVEIPAYQDAHHQAAAAARLAEPARHRARPSTVDMDKAADDGAFLDLEKYYNKSTLMQKVVTKDLVDMARSPKGLLYGIPALNTRRSATSSTSCARDFYGQYGKKADHRRGVNEFLRW